MTYPAKDARTVISSLLGGAALCGLLCGAAGRTGDQTDKAPVSVATVTAQDVPVTLQMVGHISALRAVVVHTQVAGQLMSVGFQEGQPVSAGQILASIDPRLLQATVAQDEANVAQDRASLDNTQAVLTRSIPLSAKGLISAQELQTQRAQVLSLHARVAADQAALQHDQVQLGYTRITAPMDGIAGLLLVSPGNIVTPQDPTGLLRVTQIAPIAALFALPGASLPVVQQAIEAAGPDGLAVQAWSQSGRQRLDTGRVSAVDNQLDQASGTVMLKALFANQKRLLWPGEFVNIRLVLRISHDAVAVPLDVVERGPDGPFVWTLDTEGKARLTSVRVDQSTNGMALISSGLKPGDRIVTNGQYGLVDGRETMILQPGQGGQNGRTIRNTDDDHLGIVP